ncbi:NAD(P)H-dependent oxidoreductase, partial [Paraburkholderia sp. SIMBA_030]|uniref:NAD(P)H-dependent oxidoreductase n=1 Tax=Paraburkholderia sp. SIMBA_030 TaxID=3085773 RepID=UPI00397BAC64
SILPDASVSRRDLGYEPIPHAGADYAAALATPASLAAAGRSADALLLAEQLIDEVERSDVVVIGTPMNNFTVPSVLKAWVDQIL